MLSVNNRIQNFCSYINLLPKQNKTQNQNCSQGCNRESKGKTNVLFGFFVTCTYLLSGANAKVNNRAISVFQDYEHNNYAVRFPIEIQSHVVNILDTCQAKETYTQLYTPFSEQITGVRLLQKYTPYFEIVVPKGLDFSAQMPTSQLSIYTMKNSVPSILFLNCITNGIEKLKAPQKPINSSISSDFILKNIDANEAGPQFSKCSVTTVVASNIENDIMKARTEIFRLRLRIIVTVLQCLIVLLIMMLLPPLLALLPRPRNNAAHAANDANAANAANVHPNQEPLLDLNIAEARLENLEQKIEEQLKLWTSGINAFTLKESISKLEKIKCKLKKLSDVFSCPISHSLMGNPVTLSSGVTFEKKAIQEYLSQNRNTCPKTMVKLLENKETSLRINLTIKEYIFNTIKFYDDKFIKIKNNAQTLIDFQPDLVKVVLNPGALEGEDDLVRTDIRILS